MMGKMSFAIILTILSLAGINSTAFAATDSQADYLPQAQVTQLIEKGAIWKYLDDGSDQGSAWSISSFDDSSWASGPAQLGYGDGGTVTTLSYGADSSNKYPTTYLRHTFTIQNPNEFEEFYVDLRRDDGVVIYVNGVEIIRDNMPTGNINYLTKATTAISGSNESIYTRYVIPTSLLAAANGANTMAVELHQASNGSSDLIFDLALIGARLTDESHSYRLRSNSPENTEVGNLNIFNPNNKALTYTIVEDVPFSINASGVIETTEILDANVTARYDFTINVNNGTDTVSTAVDVTVFNNTPPTFIGGSGHYAIAENAATNRSIGFVKATDADGDAITYTLSDTNVPFAIDSSTGEITVNGTLDRSIGVQQTISVSASDGTDNTLSTQTILLIPTADANTTGILLEHWTGISGNSVSNLTSTPNYPANPTQTSILTSFEAPSQDYGSYGQRVSGYLKVAESAEYTFWIASDDESELRLSTDTSPTNMGEPIASVDGWTSSQQWTKYATQKSESIYLVAGRLYYIEALHKEGSGGDHVAVALQKAGDATLTLITGSQVIPPYIVDSIAPTSPASLGADSVSANSVELVWSAASDAIGVVNYNIYRDGVLIATVAGNVLSYIDNGVTANTLHNYQVIAVDAFGNESTAATLTVDTSTTVDSVEKALQTGDARHVLNANNLIQAAIDEIDASASYMLDDKTQLFNLNADGSTKDDNSSLTDIDWNPTHDAATLLSTVGKNTSILQTNDVTDSEKTIYQKNIGIIGKTPSRYMALGSNPLRNAYRGSSSVNADMHQLMENSMSWLTQRNDLKTQPFNVVIAHMGQSGYFPDEVATRTWLDTHYSEQVTYNTQDACDGEALAGCLNSNPDLLIISQLSGGNQGATEIAATVKQAMEQGLPVLYLHYDGGLYDLGKALFSVFDITYEWDNYWKKLRLTDFDISQSINALPESLQSIKRMLEHLRDADYAFDWSQCDGNNSCNEGSPQDTEFLQGAANVRTIMKSLDTSKRNIFAEEGLRLNKLLALIGDRLRQDVTYPMDKDTTDDTVFMKSLYADNAVYNYRLLNPAQADMGNFSRSDFSHITPTTRTVNLTSKKNFRSTGAYAIPGQTFTVTRNDSSDLTVKVFINTLRDGATHLYQLNGYKRPKYLQSTHFEIASGETIELTSPYGGPIQLSFSTNDLPVNVTFENVGEHAYWAGPEDDASFTAKLDAGEFDWAEVVTSGFEVHSKLEKMRTSVADTKWGTAQALANATERYMSNFPHVLAGFQGPGIDIVDEIHDFATSNNLTIETLDLVKHMNADQATCGYGCSGNPYDAYWSYSPVGHGDVHELGHGLEKHRFRFAGWEGHSITNPYSYYTKSKYNETVGSAGNLTECQNLPFESVFETLQESVGQANIVEYLQTNLWESSGWSQQFMVLIQAVMHAQKMGKLENGWHLLARLHILEREISRADDDWEANKASIGFSSYSLEEFNDISSSSIKTTDIRRNDWMLVSLSYAAGLDYRDYLTMFGIEFSQQASDQVASFNYSVVPQEFFISSSSGYCNENINGDFLAKSTLPIDGTQVWPAETDTDGDGYWDALDNCPNNTNDEQTDTDNDGLGDACDSTPNGDSDNDGIDNLTDNCPTTSNPDQLNTDGDSQGNSCDTDDDNDGLPDLWEKENGLNAIDASDATADNDSDGIDNLGEYLAGTNPTDGGDYPGTDQNETLLGIYYGGEDWSIDKVNRLENWHGKKNAVLLLYTNWNPSTQSNLFTHQLPNIWNNGHVPLITWMPSSSTHTDYATKHIGLQVASGEHDAYITSWATELKDFLSGNDGIYGNDDDRRAYISMGHEMNGNWYHWSGSPTDYIAMWRHVRGVVNTLGIDANHLQWMWVVNNFDIGGYTAEQYYPGDTYVDWVGMNGYNWGNAVTATNYSGPNVVFDSMLARLKALTNKPISINEVASWTDNSTESIAAKEQWIRELFSYVRNQGIQLLSWFNKDKSGYDWQIFDGVVGADTLDDNVTHVYPSYKAGVKYPGLIYGDSSNAKIISDSAFQGNNKQSNPSFTLDIDGDGNVKPLTDGLLVLRYLFGFTGETLIKDAVDLEATRKTASEITAYIQSAITQLDIDGDGEAKALSDGLLLLRYLFNFTGNTLVENALEQGATRQTPAEVESYIQSLKP